MTRVLVGAVALLLSTEMAEAMVAHLPARQNQLDLPLVHVGDTSAPQVGTVVDADNMVGHPPGAIPGGQIAAADAGEMSAPQLGSLADPDAKAGDVAGSLPGDQITEAPAVEISAPQVVTLADPDAKAGDVAGSLPPDQIAAADAGEMSPPPVGTVVDPDVKAGYVGGSLPEDQITETVEPDAKVGDVAEALPGDEITEAEAFAEKAQDELRALEAEVVQAAEATAAAARKALFKSRKHHLEELKEQLKDMNKLEWADDIVNLENSVSQELMRILEAKRQTVLAAGRNTTSAERAIEKQEEATIQDAWAHVPDGSVKDAAEKDESERKTVVENDESEIPAERRNVANQERRMEALGDAKIRAGGDLFKDTMRTITDEEGSVDEKLDLINAIFQQYEDDVVDVRDDIDTNEVDIEEEEGDEVTKEEEDAIKNEDVIVKKEADEVNNIIQAS